jgi:hypothetical protein
MQRHPETTQEHLAFQSKLESAHDQARVAALTESEMENIRTDVDGGGSGAAGGEGSERNEEEQTEEEKKLLLVPPGDEKHLIDITV